MDANSQATEQDLDLFGNVVEPLRDRRGRPSFKVSKENQDFVAVRAAAGWTQERIAEAIGCDPKTLRKNFSRELHAGQLIIEGYCLDVLLQGVRKGHVPSVKQLQARLDKIAVPPQKQTKTDAGDEPEKSEPLGKKEQRLEEAAKPSSGYGDLYARLRRQ